MFKNPPTQDDLYHYFGVPIDRLSIYTACKQEKRMIWHMIARCVLDVNDLIFFLCLHIIGKV